MTKDDIILMADASGLSFYGMGKDREKFIYYLEAFATLVAAAEREWVGLDEDEIRNLYGKDLNYRDGNYVRYAKSVEAKLKERNT